MMVITSQPFSATAIASTLLGVISPTTPLTVEPEITAKTGPPKT